MSELIFTIVHSELKLEGFKSLIEDMTFADQSLAERLKKQLQDLKFSFDEIIEKKYFELNSPQTICLFTNCIYSRELLKKLAREKNKLIHSKIMIETTYNSAINSELVKSQFVELSLSSLPEIQILQKNLFSVPLNLPRTIYPATNYQVVAPDLYFQRIQTWPDILKVQSLLARDFTIKNVLFWQKFFSTGLMNKIFNNPHIAKRANVIGRNCRIHPTAILESCVIGDNVEIGPFSYLRAAVVGSNTIIRENSSIKLSTIGQGSYILPCDIFNSYLGKETCITTHILFHTLISDSTFLGGAVGFADLNATKAQVKVSQQNPVDNDQMFLGSAVAENCFIGAGLLFQVGRLIPHDTVILNHDMIHKNDFKSEKYYISKAAKVTQIPKSFIVNEINE